MQIYGPSQLHGPQSIAAPHGTRPAQPTTRPEAAQIADMGMRGRQKMKDQFGEKAPPAVSKFAEEIAERYGKKGGA